MAGTDFAQLAEEIRQISNHFHAASRTLRGGERRNEDDYVSIKAAFGADAFENRHFHKLSHFLGVAAAKDAPPLTTALADLELTDKKGLIRAMMVRAAVHHDIVYHQFDHAFAPGVEDTLLPYMKVDSSASPAAIEIKPAGEAGQNLQIFNAVNTLFGYEPGRKLDPYNGQNEYLSALFAAEMGVKQGIPLKYILGEIAMIESTVPWGGADRLTNLEQRLAQANAMLPEESHLSEAEIKGIIAGASVLCNLDVKGMAKFEEFHKGTIDIIREGGNHLEEIQASMRGIKKQVDFLSYLLNGSESGKMGIFHTYEYMDGKFIPPRDHIEVQETQAQQNIRDEIHFLKALFVADAYLAVEAKSRPDVSPKYTELGRDMRVIRNLGDPYYAALAQHEAELSGTGLAVELMKHHDVNGLYEETLEHTVKDNQVVSPEEISGVSIPQSVRIYINQNFCNTPHPAREVAR